jgi:hypothetical protein
MVMTLSSPTLVFPAKVREQVLSQHRELRSLIGGLLERCDCDVTSGAVERERFAAMVRHLHRSFGAHLEFEEQTLGPVLAVVDHWGPERLRAMHEEHTRQRADLADLLEDMKPGGDPERLVRVVRRLGTDLLKDMDDEEDGCLRPTLLVATFLEIERR